MKRRDVCLGLAALGGASLARAQAPGETTWPAQPVKLVMPFPPGGAGDGLARMLGLAFARDLGVPFIIDNRPGASAAIGSSYLLQSPPDGYTLMLAGPGAIITNRFTMKKVPYDMDAFTRIGTLSTQPYTLAASVSAPFHDIPGLVAYARANPGRLTYGSFGLGTFANLLGEMFKNATHTDMLHVPFKGSSQAIPALLGGQIDIYIDAPAALVPLVRQGRLRILGVSSPRRAAILPDTPTIAEQGYPTVELTSWNAIVGPPRLPPAIVAKMNASIGRVMAQADVLQKLGETGAEPMTGSQADFDERMRRDVPRIQSLVKLAGIEPE